MKNGLKKGLGLSLLMLIVTLGAFIAIWTAVSRHDEIVTARGFPVEDDFQPRVISAGTDGLIEMIYVNPNQPIQAGQTLFSISSPQLETRIESTQDEMALLEVELARLAAERENNTALNVRDHHLSRYPDLVELQKQTLAERLKIHQAARRLTEEEVAMKFAAHDRTVLDVEFIESQRRNLKTSDAALFPKSWQMTAKQWDSLAAERKERFLNQRLNEARLEENAALAALGKAEAAREQTEADIRARLSEESSDKRRQLESLKSQLAELYRQKEQLMVRASESGTVRSIFAAEPGTPIRAGSALLSYMPMSRDGFVSAFVGLQLARQLERGQEAQVMIGSKLYTGSVEAISRDPARRTSQTGEQHQVMVRVRNLPQNEQARSPITVHVKTGEHSLLNTLIQPLKQQQKTS